MILETQRAGYKEQLQRVQGWALATELRTSSDNLTQYSRAFVTPEILYGSIGIF